MHYVVILYWHETADLHIGYACTDEERRAMLRELEKRNDGTCEVTMLPGHFHNYRMGVV